MTIVHVFKNPCVSSRFGRKSKVKNQLTKNRTSGTVLGRFGESPDLSPRHLLWPGLAIFSSRAACGWGAVAQPCVLASKDLARGDMEENEWNIYEHIV